MFNIALGLFLFLSPVVILLGSNARVNGGILALQFYQFKSLLLNNNILQLQFFEYGVLVLFLVALMRKPERRFKDKYLGIFLGVCLVNLMFHPKTLPMMIPLLLGILLFYLVYSYASKIHRLLWVVVSVSALNTLFAVLQFFNIHLIYPPSGNINGLMCISSHLGTYQALALPVCYYFNPYLAIIPLIGLLLSGNMTALIGAGVGMGYLLWRKLFSHGSIFFMLCGSLATGLFIKFFQLQKLSCRAWVWIHTFREIIKHPIAGYGLETFGVRHPHFGYFTSPYNLYLGLAYSLGLAGLLVLLFFIDDKFRIYKTKLTMAVFASCLTLMVIGLGQSFMDFPRLAGTAIVLVALLKIRQEEENVKNGKVKI